MMKTMMAVATLALLVFAGPVAAERSAEDMRYSDAGFQINPTRLVYGTVGRCAKASAYLVPAVYLNVSIRNKQRAGGGLGASAKGRVYVDGLDKAELQKEAAVIQSPIIGQLRSAGFKVLTFDDVRSDVASRSTMPANPRYGLPTRDTRFIPGIDFAVAAPSDAQLLDYGMMGPHVNYGDAAKRTGATLLFADVYVTVPQLGAEVGGSSGLTCKSSTAKVTYSPAMTLQNISVYGATPGGGWCSIQVQTHGNRLLASNAGQFEEVGSASNEYGDWATQRSDFAFKVDRDAFETGIDRLGRSLGRVVTEIMSGRKYAP